MDEGCGRLLASQEIESRLASGWSALEQGDIEEARSALREVHDACPTHPALPLLAAEIRSKRPWQIPWRAVVLAAVVVLIAGGYALSSRSPRALQAQPTENEAQPAQSTRSASVASPSRPTGSAGPGEAVATPEPRRNIGDAPVDDDGVIRAAIARFVSAYRSRWRPLAFHGCQLERQVDTATATCRAPSTDPADGADEVWTFRLQRSAGSWKILSVQSPPAADRH
jgi:hypothetical protein